MTPLKEKVMRKISRPIFIAGICFIFAMTCLAGAFVYSSYRVDTSALKHILQLQSGKNNFGPLGKNEIGVESVDDVRYVVQGPLNLQIHYGRQVINMPPKAFEDSRFRDMLKQVGVEVKFHDNGDGTYQYRVTYWGEPCEEKSRIN